LTVRLRHTLLASGGPRRSIVKETEMNERWIVKSFDPKTIGGNWGVGATREEAVANARKAGAKKRDKFRVWRFTSELPFAPIDRGAFNDEADCWVGQDGSTNWIRCERELIEE